MLLVPVTLGFILVLAPLVGATWLLRTALQVLVLCVGLGALLVRAVLPESVPWRVQQAARLLMLVVLWLLCGLLGPLLLACLHFVWGDATAVAVVGAIGALFTAAAAVPVIIVVRLLLHSLAQARRS